MIWQHGSRTRQDGGTEGEIKKCKDEIRELKERVKGLEMVVTSILAEERVEGLEMARVFSLLSGKEDKAEDIKEDGQ